MKAIASGLNCKSSRGHEVHSFTLLGLGSCTLVVLVLGLVGVFGLDGMVSHAVGVSELVLVRVVVEVVIFDRSLLSGGGVVVEVWRRG